jgi:Capsule biosynthesis CapC
MWTELNTPEIYRLALLIGAFVAVNYKDKYGVIPGGIIIPGYLIILFLISPLWCITTFNLSFLVYFIYQKYLVSTNYKRRTPMYILGALSLALANLVGLIYIQLGWLTPSLDNLSGSLVPGIIAFTLSKQRMDKVLKGIAISTVLTAGILAIVYLIGSEVFYLDWNTLNRLYAGSDTLDLKYSLIQFYLALAIGYGVYHFHGIRSGGYLITPITAALLLKPISAITFLLGGFLVYWATQLLTELTLTIGLKRYVLVLYLSTIWVWGTELFLAKIDATILPFSQSNLLVIIALLSTVNDAILYETKNILPWLTFTVFISLSFQMFITHLSKVFV